MKIYLIGTGMEGDRTLTREAMEAIAEAELLIGAERMLAPYKDTRKTFCAYHPDAIASRLRTGTEACAAVLLSGDCGFFSGARKLGKLLEGEDVQCISGISTPVYFSSKIGIPWEQMKFVSLHGIENSIAVHVRSSRYCCFLLGGRIKAAMLCERLCDYGLEDVIVYIGENLGYENENIISAKASELLYWQAERLLFRWKWRCAVRTAWCMPLTKTPKPSALPMKTAAAFSVTISAFLRAFVLMRFQSCLCRTGFSSAAAAVH